MKSRSFSVSGRFYQQLVDVVEAQRAAAPSNVERRKLSIAALVEAALADFEPDADFVERCQLTTRESSIPTVRLTLPAGLGDPRLPKPSGRDVLSSRMPIEVSREMFGFVDDLVTRARELDGREVSHSEVFESAIQLALRAAQQGCAA